MSEQQKYDRDSCDICSQRFDCEKVKQFDKGENINLHNCRNFDDVFAK